MALIPKVLVVSDRHRTSPLWGFDITQRLNIILETNLASVVQRWAKILPEIIVFEIDSEILAIELIKRLRQETICPILLVSTICSDKFMLEVYQAGVDEYILKPIHPPLFHAKLMAWLRHSWSVPGYMLLPVNINDVRLIPQHRCILLANQNPVYLTNLELRLLYCLMSRPGFVIKTEELYQRIWGESGKGNEIRLKNVVYRLRRKIEADPAHPRYLLTVTGVGYQFKPS